MSGRPRKPDWLSMDLPAGELFVEALDREHASVVEAGESARA